MDYETIMDMHDRQKNIVLFRFEKGQIDMPEAVNLLFVNRQWMQLAVSEDCPHVWEEISVADLDPGTKAEFDTEEGFPLCSIIKYRDLVIPCYDDEYGQQVFCKIMDQEVSGGAYNFGYAEMFVHEADYLIDDKDLEESVKKKTAGE